MHETTPYYSGFIKMSSKRRSRDSARKAGKNSTGCGKRRSWTKEEDDRLRKFFAKNRPWAKIAKLFNNGHEPAFARSGKQCRERYTNHLDPKINHSEFTEEEKRKIVQLFEEHGKKIRRNISFIFNYQCNR